MANVTKTVYLYGYVQDGVMEWYTIYDSKLMTPFVKLGETQVSIEYPDGDWWKPDIVAELRKEQDGIRAEMQGKINHIEQQISKLLSLTMAPVAVPEPYMNLSAALDPTIDNDDFPF